MEKIPREVREICDSCELPGSGSRILHERSFPPPEQDEASRALLDLSERLHRRTRYPDIVRYRAGRRQRRYR
jgi:hypothetical protein